VRPAVHIGIDPGLTGAIAAVTADGALMWADDMPVLAGRVDAHELVDFFEIEVVTNVTVEIVGTRPGQGAPGVLKMGTNYGIVLGVIGALCLPVEHVTPAVWKKAMGVTADKETSLRRARELWPTMADRFARKKDDGRAEAALIALYGMRKWRGER
jgi:crossover junction endodeoxyribonuclease RuvC